MDERIKQQLDFALELDKEKNVFRQTHLSGHGRNENDAEHAWHMAVMAYLLKEYSNEPVDIARVMIMCLIHDVVEIPRGLRPRRKERMPRRREFSPCFRRIRRRSLLRSLMNLRQMRPRRRSLRMRWTTSSRLF